MQPGEAQTHTQAEPSPERGLSFLGRVFARRKQGDDAVPLATEESEPSAGEAMGAAAPIAAETAETPSQPERIENPPTLLQKLSEIAKNEPAADIGEEPTDAHAAGDEPEPADEPGPLTLSLMELQAKIKKEKPSQIRAFPWLRG